MGCDVLSKRYVEAVVPLAVRQNVVEQVKQELATLSDLYQQDKNFRTMLLHPKVRLEQKKEMIHTLFGSRWSPLVVGLLLLIIEKKRALIIPTLALQFSLVSDRYRGLTTLSVETPFPLSSEASGQIVHFFSRLSSRQVRVRQTLQRRLLGGVRLKIRDFVLDDSLETKLQSIQEALLVR